MSETFQYEASIVVESNGMQAPKWMVKRWEDKANRPDDYTEALIAVHTNNPTEAIQAAISRGSWA